VEGNSKVRAQSKRFYDNQERALVEYVRDQSVSQQMQPVEISIIDELALYRRQRIGPKNSWDIRGKAFAFPRSNFHCLIQIFEALGDVRLAKKK
jgi:hypothetical protein